MYFELFIIIILIDQFYYITFTFLSSFFSFVFSLFSFFFFFFLCFLRSLFLSLFLAHFSFQFFQFDRFFIVHHVWINILLVLIEFVVIVVFDRELLKSFSSLSMSDDALSLLLLFLIRKRFWLRNSIIHECLTHICRHKSHVMTNIKILHERHVFDYYRFTFCMLKYE